MKLGMRKVEVPSIGYKRKAASFNELFASSLPLDVAEYQWRLSTPVSTLLLAVLAVVVSRSAPRSSRYMKTIGALLIYVIYFNLTAMAKTWVETGAVKTVPGIWWVHCVLLAVIIGLLMLPRWRFRRAARLRLDQSAVTG
jgi:lipopolysaccharide export system permease protein